MNVGVACGFITFEETGVGECGIAVGGGVVFRVVFGKLIVGEVAQRGAEIV